MNTSKISTYSGLSESGQNTNQRQDKIFSKMLRAGSKNYFFNVRQASNGSNYLTISESYKNQKGEQVNNRILVFKDHAQDFIEAFNEVGAYLK